MNKRQAKKRTKKIAMWYFGLDSVRPKCHLCQNFESGDSSVGLFDSCVADCQLDEDYNLIDGKDEMMDNHMNLGGYICPYFCMVTKPKFALQTPPKSYKKIKSLIKAERKLYET